MDQISKIGLNDKSKEALKEALIGVKDHREEAFMLLNSIPEVYLPDIVEYFRILTGLKKIDRRQ